MLPASIPIFPLPNVVLFPGVFLPLHIFERRYRDMVADALAGDRIVGIVLLKPGWEHEYHARPAVYDTGCAGLITHAERLPDGRFNIVLNGLEKFRVVAEETGGALYRVARVDTLIEPVAAAERDALCEARRRLEGLLRRQVERGTSDVKIPPRMRDKELVNLLAQYLDLEPVEKQALLERPGSLARCQSLIELLEIRGLAADCQWSASRVH